MLCTVPGYAARNPSELPYARMPRCVLTPAPSEFVMRWIHGHRGGFARDGHCRTPASGVTSHGMREVEIGISRREIFGVGQTRRRDLRP